jgi:hypothetical protein
VGLLLKLVAIPSLVNSLAYLYKIGVSQPKMGNVNMPLFLTRHSRNQTGNVKIQKVEILQNAL